MQAQSETYHNMIDMGFKVGTDVYPYSALRLARPDTTLFYKTIGNYEAIVYISNYLTQSYPKKRRVLFGIMNRYSGQNPDMFVWEGKKLGTSAFDELKQDSIRKSIRRFESRVKKPSRFSAHQQRLIRELDEYNELNDNIMLAHGYSLMYINEGIVTKSIFMNSITNKILVMKLYNAVDVHIDVSTKRMESISMRYDFNVKSMDKLAAIKEKINKQITYKQGVYVLKDWRESFIHNNLSVSLLYDCHMHCMDMSILNDDLKKMPVGQRIITDFITKKQEKS